MRMPVAPLTPDECFHRLQHALARLPATVQQPRCVILAVSGGADSLALMLGASWTCAAFRARGVSFRVVTVDHALRAGSAEEAEGVAALARRFGLAHETLRWVRTGPIRNLQADAREARYGLLEAAAQDCGAVAVMTAHHLDDQIETHLLAAARGAGDRGLAGMRAARQLGPNVTLLRPFLDLPGARLAETVRQSGLCPVDDPSNRDPRFDRVRIRASIARAEIDREACIVAIARAAAGRDAADEELARALDALLDERCMQSLGENGSLSIDANAFMRMPQETRLDLLSRVLPALAGALYSPPRDALHRLLERLLEKAPCRLTLGGALVERSDAAGLRFLREYGRAGPAPEGFTDGAGSPSTVFDRRFRVATRGLGKGMLIPAGRLGLGNLAERTLPVAVDGEGRPIAATPSLVKKIRGPLASLEFCEDISWRLMADLPWSTSSRQNRLSLRS